MNGKRKARTVKPQLTAEEKAERDARAMYWMQQRKIEAVAEAAWRHGWDVMSGGLVNWAIDAGISELDDTGELVIIIPNYTDTPTTGQIHVEKFRLHEYDAPRDQYKVRKISDEYIQN